MISSENVVPSMICLGLIEEIKTLKLSVIVHVFEQDEERGRH